MRDRISSGTMKMVVSLEKKRRHKIMDKSEIAKILAGLKGIQDGGIVQDFQQKRALQEAVGHYEKWQKEKEADRVRVVLQIVVTSITHFK